ncbi:SEL1-like repeat protein [Aeoliella mucimassa]|nr:hypothetical protein [Aeoliella mucimassa]
MSLATPEAILMHINILKELVEAGNGRAAMQLAEVHFAILLSEEEDKMALLTSIKSPSEYHQIAFKHLTQEAMSGDGEAMHDLAVYFQVGRGGAPTDMEKCIEWNENALAAGYYFAANDLYTTYTTSPSHLNPERAKEMAEILRSHNCAVVELP